MTKKAFIVTGLGYGDEGKGTTTHFLACRHKAHTVIRTGGPQALHHVVTGTGKSHVFSQFGSGSLRGSATHLSKHMLIDPHAILEEGKSLMYENGVRGVFEAMTIHEDALVVTPFQAIAGRVRELVRGKNRRGSVGIGVGETVSDSKVLKDGAIRAKDLATTSLRKKLEEIQAYKWAAFEEYADRACGLPKEALARVRLELSNLENKDTIEWAVEHFTELTKRVRIVDTEYVRREILQPEGAVVFEGSQGVLLDPHYGFHPYTTQVRTTPWGAKRILLECGYDGEVQSLGILRAYHTRHGAGPFVCESPELTKALPDSANKEHPWQGNFRVGHLDLVALQYALTACGEGAFSGLVITCLDRVLKQGSWTTCHSYSMSDPVQDMQSLFAFNQGRITAILTQREKNEELRLARQERLGQTLAKCAPQLTTFNVTNFSQEKFIDLCTSIIQKVQCVPVVAVSIGETERDKIEMRKGQ